MPKEKNIHHHLNQKIYVHRPSMDEDDDESVTIIPSGSNVLIDDGCQVSTESILEANDNAFIAGPGQKMKKHTARSCLPDIVVKPPEIIRGVLLNKGGSYWRTSMKSSMILALASLAELLIYFFVYGLMGHFRIILALLPIRRTIVIWFLIMFGADSMCMVIIRLGKCLSYKFGTTKKVDMYFILISTILLIISFLLSIGYPVYATPHLMTKVKGTIIQNVTFCMQYRDEFTQAGTSWDSIPTLRKICDDHVLCVENCRDFRDMYLWFYGTYILTVIRLFVLIILWDNCSFLCMVMDIREENITYTINLSSGYHR